MLIRYPAFQSYKAIINGNPELHAQWLTYWIVNTYVTLFEYFCDFILSWLPFYWEGKIALFIWLVSPRFNGASILYNDVISPYLSKHENDIDSGIVKIREKGSAQVKEIAKDAFDKLQKRTQELVVTSNSGIDKISNIVLVNAAVSLVQQKINQQIQIEQQNMQSNENLIVDTRKQDDEKGQVNITELKQESILVENKEISETNKNIEVGIDNESIESPNILRRDTSLISLSQFRDSLDEDN